MALAVKQDHDTSTVCAEYTTETGASVDATTDAVRLTRPPRGFVFVLDVTAAAAGVLDELAISIQTRFDTPGANWITVVQFATVLGNGGAKQYIEKIAATATEAGYEAGTALAAGTVRNLLGDDWRCHIVQQPAGDAAFTFTVTACPM